MACFLVPVAEAAVVTVITKAREAEEAKRGSTETHGAEAAFEEKCNPRFSQKLKWLTNMLGGGSALLAFEHVWHGEVTPWFPFLTAAGDPAETAVMLREMATVGVYMAVLVTAVWGIMVLAAKAMEKKTLKAQTSAE